MAVDVVMRMRLDKYLSDMGTGTRSQVKKWIRTGMVTVNGLPERKPEAKITPGTDQVVWKDQLIPYHRHEYYMLNKPAGVVSAVSDRSEQTVLDLIKETKRSGLFPVGRLDKDTEGLLLITDDGELAHHLLAPRHHVDKTYYARICGVVTEKDRILFHEGLDIGDEKPTLPADLEILNSGEISEIRLTIQEGRFHQVKRMFQAVNKKVIYLKRLRMGSLVLDSSLNPGDYRKLTDKEVESLCSKTKKQ